MKRNLFILVLICFAAFSVFSSPIEKDIMLSDIPITYGEEAFVQRIEERSKGRQPVGIVLSGGSARAMAHVGVLKYMEENGIVPDFVIANSMGAIVATLYTAGVSPDQIGRMFTEMEPGSLFEVQLPIKTGMISTEKFNSMFAGILGKDYRLEDSEIPVMLIAEDLYSRRQIRLCEGNAVEALSASMAMPFYFDTVETNGHTTTDGGVYELIPLELAKEYSDNIILSTTFYDTKSDLHNGITVLNETLSLGKTRNGIIQIKNNPDVIWLRCDVEHFSFMAFDKFDQIVSKGYECAQMHKEELENLLPICGGVSSSLVAKRAEFDGILDRTISDLALYGHVSYRKPVFRFTLKNETKDRPVFRMPEARKVFSGLGAEYSNGDWAVGAAVGFDFSTNSRIKLFKPAVRVLGNCYVTENIKASAGLGLRFDRTFDLYESVMYRAGKFSLTETFELERSSAGSVNTVFSGFAGFSSGDLKVDSGLEFRNAKLYLCADGSYSFHVPSYPVGVRLSAAASAPAAELKNSTVDSDVDVVYELRNFEKTIAEAFMLKNVSGGLWVGTTLGRGADRRTTVGVVVSSDLKLIGIINCPVEARAGWDFSGKRFEYSVRFGL